MKTKKEKVKTEKKELKKVGKTMVEKNTMREDFLILKNLVYLDNSATTQKPKVVIDSINDFYSNYNSNSHSGIYKIAEKTAEKIEDSREKIAKFINAKTDEIIFTKSATESINNLARVFENKYYTNTKSNSKSNIVVTELEHNSNFLPWQQLAKRKNIELRVVEFIENQNLKNIHSYVDSNTIIVSFTLMSNVSGLIVDAKSIISEIRKKNKNTIIIIDATQAAAHIKIDVQNLGADFICFSMHKIYGPLGVGILWGKKELLEKLNPFLFGGNMVNSVSKTSADWKDVPYRFEAGTIDAAGIIGSRVAIDYLTNHDFNKLLKFENELKEYALINLRKIKGMKIIGHLKDNSSAYGPVISFNLEGIHPHDLASICDRYNICIRAGTHCAMLFHQRLNIPASARISISFYNTKEDIDKLINALIEAKRLLYG